MIAVAPGGEGRPLKCPHCHEAVTAIRHETPTPAPAAPPEDPAPQRLGGYEILEAIGEGGMGVVYKARNLRLDRTVALKLLPTRFARPGSEPLERFLREARAAAQLDHPNVVAIHAVGEAEGRHFIEMQLVQGRTLAQALSGGKRLPAPEALRIVKEVARALKATHAKGIVHRDIKPDNIMLADGGAVRVMDFGLARSEAASAITGDGQVIGTPHYMSPEQCDGKPADRRSDIYSLGATFYRMLSGRPPFSGDTPLAVMRQHAEKPTPPLDEEARNAPGEVVRIVNRMLEKRPEDRYQNCDEVLSAIAHAEGTPETGARRRWDRRKVLVAVAVGVFLVKAIVMNCPYLRSTDTPDFRPASSVANFPSPAARAFGEGLVREKRARVSGRTLSVSQQGAADYHTIGAAIAGAKAGDAIEIRDSGTYPEEVTLNKANLLLRAAPGQTPTVDAEGRRAHAVAVEASGRGAVVEGLRCLRATNDGILVLAGADEVILFANTCSENRWGIRIKGNQAVAIANVAQSNESYGIQLWESERSTVSDNLCCGNSAGVDLCRGRDCAAVGNVLYGNRKGGFQLREAERAHVAGNLCHQCEGDGIELDRSKAVEIADNLIVSCRGAGIAFDTKCAEITAHHNNVFGCRSYGRCERKAFKDLTAWKAEAGMGAESMSVAPGFADPPTDLTLRTDSPCRGKAADGLDIGVVWTKSGMARRSPPK